MRSEVTNVSYGDRCICRKSRDSDNIKDVIPTTRVYKKSSPSGKLTCYIGYREVYSDLLTSSDDNECDFLEGAILLNADDNCVYTVYLNLQATLRFGIPNRSSRNKRTTAAAATATNQHLSNRHHFQSSVALYTQNQRVNIVSTSSPGPPTLAGLTLLQQRLLKKLGPTARPFLFKLRKSSPFSSQIVMRRRAVNPIASSSSISSSLVPTRCLALVDYELRVSMVAGMSDSTALAVVNEHRLLRQRSPTSVPILIDLDSLMGASANKRNALRLSIRKLAIASPLSIGFHCC